MDHDFAISVAAEAIPVPHEQPAVHPLRVTWIYDPAFRYTPSFATDLRKTFERVRRQLQERDGSGNVKVLRLAARTSSTFQRLGRPESPASGRAVQVLGSGDS
jgi:hypothetical protein